MRQIAGWQQFCAAVHRHQVPLSATGTDWVIFKPCRAASAKARSVARQRPWLHGAAISRHVSASCRLSARQLPQPALKQVSEVVVGGMSRGACAAAQANTHPGKSGGPPEGITGEVSADTDVLNPPGSAREPASSATDVQLPSQADEPRISAASGSPSDNSQPALPWSESPALKFEVCGGASKTLCLRQPSLPVSPASTPVRASCVLARSDHAVCRRLFASTDG